MKRAVALIIPVLFLSAVEAAGMAAGYVDCYGGMEADGQYWQLLDRQGQPLEDGDWVYAAWTGPDGEIDPPDARGLPGGDDVKLPVASERIEYSSFMLVVATWEQGYRDDTGQERHPFDGELIYCRIFDDPEESVGPETHYSDSQLYAVTWKMGDIYFCQFPGDPGGGRVTTPLQSEGGSDRPATALPPTAAGLRQLSVHLQHPAVELEYVVPADGAVSLKIHDRLGREVAALVEAERKSGLYTQRWGGDAWPAGVYIAVLRAGEETIRRPIVLLK